MGSEEPDARDRRDPGRDGKAGGAGGGEAGAEEKALWLWLHDKMPALPTRVENGVRMLAAAET